MIYPHEHLAVDLSGPKGDIDCRLDRKDAVIAEFRGLRDRGVTLVVDLTNRGMGRDVAYALDVREKSGVQVLHATGWYKEGFFPPEAREADVEGLERIMRGEIVSGIGDTGVKASVIGEIGTEFDRITSEEERIFTAAARVQAETAVPIVTHATMGRMGMEQIGLLEARGADLSGVTISHVDLTNDLEYILRLIDRGVTVGFDTIGKTAYLDDACRVGMLKELSRRGRCGSIVLSMDITRRSHLKEEGGVGYAYLIDAFLPRLRVSDDLGQAVPEEHIRLMTQANAERLYGASRKIPE
jgi:phosphotriesterase-related protein